MTVVPFFPDAFLRKDGTVTYVMKDEGVKVLPNFPTGTALASLRPLELIPIYG